MRTAEAFAAAVEVTRDDMTVVGTSILGLMLLAAGAGTVLTLQAPRAPMPRRRWPSFAGSSRADSTSRPQPAAGLLAGRERLCLTQRDLGPARCLRGASWSVVTHA